MHKGEPTKVSYKTKGLNHQEFYILCNQDMPFLYLKGKATLIETIQSFDIFMSLSGGNSGVPNRPNKQQLENTFGSHDVEYIADFILKNGEIKQSK